MPHDAGPTFDFLRLLLEAMPAGLRAHLAVFHLVHPTLKMRLAFLLLGVLLWGKVLAMHSTCHCTLRALAVP